MNYLYPKAGPAESPYLNHSNFYICLFVKNYSFSVQIQSLSHMKERIEKPEAADRTKTLGKM